MKSIRSGIIIAAGLGVLASLVRIGMREPSYQAFSTSATRVGDPGHNLVGPHWSGMNRNAEGAT